MASARPVQTINRLVDLPDNWDSYGAKKVAAEIATVMSQLLDQVVQADTPEPTVVPTRRGGIQIEWHTRGMDLEINLLSPTRMHVDFEDARDGEAWEHESSCSDVEPLTRVIAKLSARK